MESSLEAYAERLIAIRHEMIQRGDAAAAAAIARDLQRKNVVISEKRSGTQWHIGCRPRD